MKKTLLSFAIICFSAVLVNAQDMEKKEMTTQDRVVKQTDRLTKELGLSEDQAAKLFIINKEFGDQMEARREEKRQTTMRTGKKLKLFVRLTTRKSMPF